MPVSLSPSVWSSTHTLHGSIVPYDATLPVSLTKIRTTAVVESLPAGVDDMVTLSSQSAFYRMVIHQGRTMVGEPLVQRVALTSFPSF